MSKQKTENSGARGRRAEAFSRAIDALRRGEVIVFPTETFYGLGADAFDEAAVGQVVSLKGRSPDQTVPIIVADREMLNSVVTHVSPAAQKLIDRFWPGPLTLVLPAKKNLPGPLLNRDGGVGVRISSHPLAARLARELSHPITATSANPSGREPARSVEEAMGYFSEKLEIFLDGGRLEGKKGSTVVEIVQDKLRIVREGEIPSEELKRILATWQPF